MFPEKYEKFISRYPSAFSVPDDVDDVIRRGASNDWSFVSFSPVIKEADDVAKSELASLFPLTTDVSDDFIDYMRDVVSNIAVAADECIDDYMVDNDMMRSKSSLYDLIRISSSSSKKYSVPLGGSLQEGLVLEFACISKDGASVNFPHLNVSIDMDRGDVVYAPGAFPFTHRIGTSSNALLLKRMFR